MDTGDDQDVPSKLRAYPASSTATQKLRLAQDTDNSPKSPWLHDTGVEPAPWEMCMLSGSTNSGPDHSRPFQTEV
jgi:hypothetical protein